MDLTQLRGQINEIDKELEDLFMKRMDVCLQVAEYKIENNMEVFQAEREKEIIKRVRDNADKGMENPAEVFFTTLMDISKSKQYQRFFVKNDSISCEPLDLNSFAKVAVPGTAGSYSEEAAKKMLPDSELMFFSDFEDVFRSVQDGQTDFGVLPIRNTTAGTVARTYELMRKYDFRICASTKVRVSHCLAARKGVSADEIKIVYSHEQAISQCSEFIKKNGLKAHHYANTALAAEYVSKSDEPYAAICSEFCAEDLGLEILSRDIANASANYTKFILISKDKLKVENADIITVSLALPHTQSALYRLLTKFSVAGLNLTMIESRPIANTDFDVVFYLDFEGDISDPAVSKLINELRSELSYFKFLGNYSEI